MKRNGTASVPYDDTNWFPVRVADGEPLTVSNDELRAACERLALERLKRWDDEARCRCLRVHYAKLAPPE